MMMKLQKDKKLLDDTISQISQNKISDEQKKKRKFHHFS